MEFTPRASDLVVEYRNESYGRSEHNWICQKLEEDGSVRVSKFLFVTKDDIVDDSLSDDPDATILIRVADADTGYWKFRRDVLGISFDLYIQQGRKLRRNMFVAATNVLIFRRLSEIVKGPVYIGGDHPDAIPFNTFVDMIRKIPGLTELTKYVRARLSAVLREYVDVDASAVKSYRRYLNKKLTAGRSDTFDALQTDEAEKLRFILQRMTEMLANASGFSEDQWQKEITPIILLLFPKYMAAVDKLAIKDTADPPHDRQIDIALVDVDGNIDILELKKPMDDALMSTRTYRDNHVPLRELSGAIMQVEKYILYLQRQGVLGDKRMTERVRSKAPNLLPPGMQLAVTNPRGLVIMGRNSGLTSAQMADFEIVKRKYKNIMDILSYDDLLDRIKRLLWRYDPTGAAQSTNQVAP